MNFLIPMTFLGFLSASCSSSNFAGGTSSKGGKTSGSKNTSDGPATDDEEEESGADNPAEVSGTFRPAAGIRLDPEEMTLFVGESGEFRAIDLASSRDVSKEAAWSVASPARAKSSGEGRVEAIQAGDSAIKAVMGKYSAQGQIRVVSCLTKSPTAAKAATTVEIDGENWPGNTVDPGGGDKDDYHVTITGDFLVDGFQLFARNDQTIQVSYALGTPGSTTQVVRLALIDCDGKIAASEDVSSGSGSHEFDAKKGQRFTLVTTAKTGPLTRVFQLDKDTADAKADDAFRVTLGP